MYKFLYLNLLTWLFFLTSQAQQSYYFNAPNGTWHTDSNWSGGVAPPQSYEWNHAFIGEGADHDVYVQFANAAASRVTVGADAGYSGSLSIFGGARLEVIETLEAGAVDSARAYILVSGNGSLLDTFTTTLRENAGLYVEEGGIFQGNLQLAASSQPGSEPIAYFSGSGSQLIGSVNVGSGYFSLYDSATMQGNLYSGNGHTHISGLNTQVTSDIIAAGTSGVGTIRVSNRATVDTNLLRAGFSSNGGVTITGAGTRVNVEGRGDASSTPSVYAVEIASGSSGNYGELKVENGAVLHAKSMLVNLHEDQQAHLYVSGTEGNRGVLEVGHMSGNAATGGQGGVHFNGGVLRAIQDNGYSTRIVDFEAGQIEIQAGGLFVDTAGREMEISAPMHGTGGMTVTGQGRLTLQGEQTYTGPTTVRDSSLWVDGSLQGEVVVTENGTMWMNGTISNDVTLSEGGTLYGAFTIAGDLTLERGGSIGVTAEILEMYPVGFIAETGDQTWQGGAQYLWRLASGMPSHTTDSLLVNGSINLLATEEDPFIIAVYDGMFGSALFNNESRSWTIATITGGFVGGYDSSLFFIDTSQLAAEPDGTFSLMESGNNLVLNYVANPVPEPSSTLLVLLGVSFYAFRRKR